MIAALGAFVARAEGGVVISPEKHDAPGRLVALQASHPVPDSGSVAAGERALAIARGCTARDLLVVLLSGGASSLMAAPAAGLTLADKQATTDRLLKAGADIHAFNCVRKHLSAIKGGRLAAACRGATLTLAISDVVDDDISAIASGPTVADPTTFAQALEALDRFGGRTAYPAAVVALLERGTRGDVAETPKAGDGQLDRSKATIVGGRLNASAAAAHEAAARGYQVEELRDPLVGEARVTACAHVARVASLRRQGGATCVVSTGETTVRVTGSGRGGRNQEFALAAAACAGPLGQFVAASVGTDGVDGPTDAAGAIVDDSTVARARTAGLPPPARVLDANDSYTFFNTLHDLLRTGPTGTNVGDLQVFLLA